MWGIFFGEFQCLPVDDCPAASCDSGVLARGSESTSFYSAILVPPQSYFKNLKIERKIIVQVEKTNNALISGYF